MEHFIRFLLIGITMYLALWSWFDYTKKYKQ